MERRTLTRILEDNARRFKDKLVLRWKAEGRWKGITYGEFYESAMDIGTGLARLGMKPKDRVALLSHNGPGWVISYFAILMNGGIVVPIDKELKASELRHILGDSVAKFIILSGDFLETLCEVIDLLPSLEKTITLDPFMEAQDSTMESGDSPLPGVAELELIHIDRLRQNETFIRHEMEPDDLVAIVYTS
ncbi:MAG: AMP-binding protein, partial [Syntrophobacterales bacterium]